MNWYPRYPGDYMRDTAKLTLVEHGAYTVLLDEYYSTGEPLPFDDDALIRVCRAFTEAERQAVRLIADRFFPVNGDGMRHNKRADIEIEKATGKSEKAAVAAKLRWDNERKAEAMRTHKRTHKRTDVHSECSPDTISRIQNPEATDHNPSLAPTSGARARNPIMDALGSLEGNLSELSKAAWGRVGTALKEIREVCPDVTAEEIARRARNYSTHFDGAAVTSTALAKYWARCGTSRQAQLRPPSSTFDGMQVYEGGEVVE